MSDAPEVSLDVAVLGANPYPQLARLQAKTPVAEVPELRAILMTRHATIYAQEKRGDVFSSRQPGGLMTRLMGENMMRKDGAAHAAERRACFPARAPKTVAPRWRAQFRAAADAALRDLRKAVPVGLG